MDKNTITVEELLERYTFKEVGNFYLENDKLNYNIKSEYKDITNFIYLLKTETENLYLGSSINSVKDILYKFKQGHEGQATNHNIKNKLTEKLQEIKNINIFICQINENISIDIKNISWNKGDHKMINSPKRTNEIIEKNNIKPLEKFYRNRIIYGAPGTGKSYKLKREVKENFQEKNCQRVTFYDGYTYGQFVGTYKPTPVTKEDGTETITYKYVPGPFMKQLVKAYGDKENNYCLVIEEINRAKADRVFGNIFQLLDRGKDSESEYPIMPSEDQLKYLEESLDEEKFKEIKEKGLSIPKNLYLWATMNNADQGVYPMDSAFKRRWSFEHIGINENEYKELDDGSIPGICFKKENGIKHIVSWNSFRKVINETLLANKVLEDRLLAPYFIKEKSFNEILGNVKILNETVFIDKILMYLFDDILKHKNNNILFKDNINSFSQIKDILKEKIEEKESITVFNDKIIFELEEESKKLDEIFEEKNSENNFLKSEAEKGSILYKNFWESFNEYLTKTNEEYLIFSNKSRKPSTDNWQERQIPGVYGYEIVLKLSFTKKIISTEIYMNKENAKNLFDKSYSYKEKIENDLGFTLQWFSKEKNPKFAYKAYLSKELDINNKELWDNAFIWLIENSEKMVSTFKNYI